MTTFITGFALGGIIGILYFVWPMPWNMRCYKCGCVHLGLGRCPIQRRD